MGYVKNTIRGLALLLTFSLLHYVLPQHDIARITSTEIIRMDFTNFNQLFFAQADSGATELVTRDVRLINTMKRKTFLLGFISRDAEEVMVYRNEDTGWIWPPYFKFDSSDLHAEAAASISTSEAEQWVIITHYGWRNRFFTVFPNAVGIRTIEGPDVRIIPWFNIFFFVFSAIAALFIRAMWRQFRERKLDPALSNANQAWERVDARADGAKGRVSRWFSSWRGKG